MSIHMATSIVMSPAIKSNFFPKSEKTIKKYRHIMDRIFNTSGPFEYATHLDFLVGEVLGPTFREHCRKCYYEDGKQIQKLYRKSKLDGFDDFLSLTLETCCEEASPPYEEFVDKLRDCARTEKGYREKKIRPLTIPQVKRAATPHLEERIPLTSGAIEPGILTKTEDAIANYEEALETIFNEGSPFEYRTLLDFVVGEVCGPEYRERCYDHYQMKEKKLTKIYSERSLESLDETLSGIIMQCCDNAEEVYDRLLCFLRINAKTSTKYGAYPKTTPVKKNESLNQSLSSPKNQKSISPPNSPTALLKTSSTFEGQWIGKALAKENAYVWRPRASLPPNVKTMFSTNFQLRDISPIVALANHQSFIPGETTPYANDFLLLARTKKELCAIVVDEHNSNTIGPTVEEWKNDEGTPTTDTLNRISEILNLEQHPPDQIRLHLLRRAAGIISCANQFHANTAIMLTHSFSSDNKRFEDYENFLRLYGVTAQQGLLQEVFRIPKTKFYCGWIEDNN